MLQYCNITAFLLIVVLTHIQARAPPRRAVTDENAENVGTTRVTRAKAAALDTTTGDPPKKALAAKRTTTAPTNGTINKRKALGDVSNVVKKEPSENGDAKKDTLGKNSGLLAKTTKPAGIQKQTAPSRSNSTRPALGPKAANANSSDLKRPASGSGVGGHASKKRITSTSKVENMEEDEASENVPPPKNGSSTSFKVQKQVVHPRLIACDRSADGVADADHTNGDPSAGQRHFLLVHETKLSDTSASVCPAG